MADRTPDELISDLFAVRGQQEPDCDPGDVTIEVQDDMPLVCISQRGQTIGRGSTLHAALQDAVENVTSRRAYGLAGHEPLWTFAEAFERQQATSEALRAAMTQVVADATADSD